MIGITTWLHLQFQTESLERERGRGESSPQGGLEAIEDTAYGHQVHEVDSGMEQGSSINRAGSGRLSHRPAMHFTSHLPATMACPRHQF